MKVRPLLVALAALASIAVAGPVRAEINPPPPKNPLAPPTGYTVTLEIKVNEKGEKEDLTVVGTDDESAGDVLTKLAIAMALKTNLPAREKDGHPIKYTVRAPFFFPIKDDEGPEANKVPRPRGKSAESRQPVYPPDLLARGEVGGAILELVIDKDGNVSRLTTLRASHPEIEQSARETVSKWKFIPAEKDGQPVETRWRLAIVFETTDKMASLDYRVAPRPSLGSFIFVHDTSPLPPAEPAANPAETPAAAPGASAPAAPANAAATAGEAKK